MRTTENDVHSGQTAVTTVITIGFPLMPQKQGAVKQQGQCERAVVAQNRGSVVLFWVPTLKDAVPPPPWWFYPLLAVWGYPKKGVLTTKNCSRP